MAGRGTVAVPRCSRKDRTVNGETVAEYHKYYGTAALMLVRDLHAKLGRKQPGE